MKILITGFKPFNNETANPAYDIMEKYQNESYKIEKLGLDVLYYIDAEKLIKKISEFQPDIIILLGQAGGRSYVTIERFALNIRSATIPDNNNVLIQNKKISDYSKEAYETTVDLDKITKKIDGVKISYHAGTYICNEIYYHALKYIEDNNLNSRCVFIHLPYTKEQILNKKENTPFMELNEMYDIVINIIDEIAN